MATQVKILESSIDDSYLSSQLQDFLTATGLAINDVQTLPFGDKKTKGIILIYDDGL